MFFRVILLSIVLFASIFSFGQTTYFDLSGGGAYPSGWTDVNSVTANPIDKSSYFMLEPGNPGDSIITASYDLCTHTSATLTADIGSFGSGTHNALKVEVSLDGGVTYTQTYITAVTTSSTETPITPITITPVSSTVVIRLSVDATSGRGIRIQNLKLVGNGSVSCGGGSSHTVTFDGNGNDGGSMSNQTASSSIALNSNGYTLTGCNFIEWNTASDGSGTSYTDGATYSFAVDITLYAQWSCGASNCIDEDFVDYSDWTDGGTSTDNTSGHFGAAAPCRALGSGDNLTSPPVNNPSQLQFYQDASSGGNGSTALIEYSLDGGSTWVTCYTFTVSTSGGTEVVDLTNVGGVDLSAYTGVLFQFSSSFSTWYLDDVLMTCGTVTNTITTGSISGSPFSVQCASDDNGTVAFTSTDTFGAGNVYTVQLSDASGSFSSPITIGTLSSTANSGTINITIPLGTATGSGYKIRIISSNPSVVGSESSTFTITLTDGPCTPPHITSVLFNGCDPAGCGGEGRSEIVFANTGANSVLVNSGNLDLVYPGSPPYDLLGTIVSNSSTVTTMNDSAACGTLFYDANGQTLPPNTTMLLVSSDICAEVNFDWSGLCGQGPIYVVFGQSGTTGDTWHDSGNFGNSSGTKNFDLDITATDANTYAYSYSYVSTNQGDGEYANFSSTSPGGNATSTGVLADCNVTTAVLPITLTEFNGNKQGSSNLLYWTTATEINNDFFTIEKSENAIDFEVLNYVDGAGNSNISLNYQLLDHAPYPTTYYRLKQTDFDGNYAYSNTIALSRENQSDFYFNQSSNTLVLNIDEESPNSKILIYSVQGQLIKEKSLLSKGENIQIPLNLSNGLYLISLQTGSTILSKKIVVSQ